MLEVLLLDTLAVTGLFGVLLLLSDGLGESETLLREPEEVVVVESVTVVTLVKVEVTSEDVGVVV